MEMLKAEKREKIKKNQSKMIVSGMYLRKVILPLKLKQAQQFLK